MLMLNKTPAAVTNSVIALLPHRGQSSSGSFPDDFVESGKWFRRTAALTIYRQAAALGEPCGGADRPAHDSPPKPDSRAAFLESGRRYSAVFGSDKRDHENHYRRFYIGVGHHRFRDLFGSRAGERRGPLMPGLIQQHWLSPMASNAVRLAKAAPSCG